MEYLHANNGKAEKRDHEEQEMMIILGKMAVKGNNHNDYKFL